MIKRTIFCVIMLTGFLFSLEHDSFQSRRVKIRKMLDSRSVMVLFTADEYIRNGDVHYPFRPDSDFWYLTGHPESDAILILTGNDFEGKHEIPFKDEILFAQQQNPTWERWNGKRLGRQGAKEDLGFHYFAASDSFKIVFRQIIPHIDTLFINLRNSSQDCKRQLKDTIPDRIFIANAGDIIHPERFIKSQQEIDLIKKAVDITGEAIFEAMKRAQPGLYENNIDATINFVFRDIGCKRAGFPSIVGSGSNATILHYSQNDQRLKKNDLLLMDIGAEYQMYTADITRTIPISGEFTPEQRELYSYVLKTQKIVFDSVKVGMTLLDLQKIAKNYLRNKGFDRYFVHGISHWLGLDVHDVGGRASEIQVGTVFTLEPGIYIPEDDPGFPESYRGIGIRIEDDVWMTEKGPIWLSAQIPKEINEIERIMKRKQKNVRRRSKR